MSDKRKWMNGIASEAEDAARKQHMRTLYGLTKVLCNERSKSSTTILDKSSNLMSGKKEMQARWTEHFREVLNRAEPTDPITIEDESEFELGGLIEEIVITEPTIGKIKAAIERLKNGKSPGVDSIMAELLKVHKELSAAKVRQLLEKVWKHEKIPDKWKKEGKKKENLKECKNWRGITLLSVVGKILGRIVIDRIRNGVDIRLRNEQAGYRKGRGTTEQIFKLFHIKEHC